MLELSGLYFPELRIWKVKYECRYYDLTFDPKNACSKWEYSI